MPIVTSGVRKKSYRWSYSKLKNYEVCPKRHFHVDIQKDFKEEDSDQLKYGNEVHKHLANRIGKGTAIPVGYEGLERWAEWALHGSANMQVLVEQKLAINDNFGPTDFFSNTAWYSGIADVLKLYGDVALAIDWKTGKILEDSVQLGLMASCVFAHYPQVQVVRTEFAWLKEGFGVTSREDFTRQGIVQMWRNLWPRIEQLKQAALTTTYPATPNYLCRRYCPVTSCPHHGG